MKVLDASALLAFLFGEDGIDRVREEMLVSVVNWSEAMTKVDERTPVPPADLERILRDKGILGDALQLTDFGATDARKVSELRKPTRRVGLSLGDRAALATGHRLRLTVLHAEREWKKLPPLDGISLELIR